jgi:O-antigen ligase
MIGGVRLDTSTSARLESWQSALRDFPEHPFLGYGVSGYRFLDAQIPRVLAETGLLGLSAFFYLLYSVLMMAVRRLRTATDPYDKGLIAGFLSGYIGLLVHSLGINTFIIVRIMEPFWFFAGIVAVLPLLGHEPEEAAAAPVERTAVAPIRRTRLPVPLRMD